MLKMLEIRLKLCRIEKLVGLFFEQTFIKIKLGFPSASSKKVRLAVNSDLLQPDDSYEDKPKRIRRKWTPLPPTDYRHQSLDEAVTELHILEDGLSPPPGRLATFGGRIIFKFTNKFIFYI